MLINDFCKLYGLYQYSRKMYKANQKYEIIPSMILEAKCLVLWFRVSWINSSMSSPSSVCRHLLVCDVDFSVFIYSVTLLVFVYFHLSLARLSGRKYRKHKDVQNDLYGFYIPELVRNGSSKQFRPKYPLLELSIPLRKKTLFLFRKTFSSPKRLQS